MFLMVVLTWRKLHWKKHLHYSRVLASMVMAPAENWTHPIQLPRKELRPNSRVERMEEADVTKSCIEGCARLHRIFWRALFNLKELDLWGTTIKTIDLGAMDVPRHKQLFLLGCKQLRRLFWDGRNPRLKVLHVDTNRG